TIRQRVPRLGWRHPLFRIGFGDLLDEQALGGVPPLDDALLRERALLGVEVKLRLALLLVRSVAREAIVGEDREDVAVEADRRPAGRLLRMRPEGRGGGRGESHRAARG